MRWVYWLQVTHVSFMDRDAMRSNVCDCGRMNAYIAAHFHATSTGEMGAQTCQNRRPGWSISPCISNAMPPKTQKCRSNATTHVEGLVRRLGLLRVSGHDCGGLRVAAIVSMGVVMREVSR